MPIVPAGEAHLPAINAIYNHYVVHSTCTYQTEPSTAEERLAWFRGRAAEADGLMRYPVTVALDEAGTVLGWASLNRFHARQAFRFTVENSVYVHHEHQRQGLGRALLADLIARADALRYRSIIAVISADQEPSIVLHRAFGFREAGVLKHVGFKFGRWLDVVYMQRENPSAT